jgi:hypothetical protein
MPSLSSKRGAAFLLLTLAIIAGVLIWRNFRGESRKPLSHRAVATRVLAENMGKPKKALVISNPYAQMSGRPAEVYDFQKAGVQGLRAGFGEAVELRVGYPKLKAEVLSHPESVNIDPRSKTPLSFLIEENAFGQLIASNRDCDCVISLIGAPLNLQTMNTWKSPGPPRFGFLLPDWRMIGNPAAIQSAFDNGKLAAAIIPKRGGLPDDAPTQSGYREEFEQRFVLVTRTNIATLLATQPESFH